MADLTTSGFTELEHTADWALRVWAPDLAGLFEQAARGMYALSGLQPRDGQTVARELELSGQDAESLLVRFLSELLYFAEEEALAFERFELEVEPEHLQARLTGGLAVMPQKEIKAVTYHNLAIRKTGRGLEVTIVFDV